MGPADTPVPIWQRTWEIETLVGIYRERAPLRVLEIGSKTGGSLWHWLVNARPGTHVVSIDPEYDLSAQLDEWTPEGVTVEQWHGYSRDFVERARECEPWDWLFIDADHTYDAVRADWIAYAPLVRTGGLVALHDILPCHIDPSIQVSVLWREIQREGWLTRELVADPGAEWGGIGIVYV